MNKRIVGMLVIVLVTGCAASTKPLPPYDFAGSMTDYTRELIRVTTPSAIDRLLESVTMRTGDEQTYRWLKGWWCPVHVEVQDTRSIKGLYEKACKQRAGEFLGNLCKSQSNADDVFFFAKIWQGRRCTDGSRATEVELIEPKGSLDDLAYVNALRRVGFRSQVDVAADVEKRETEAAEARKKQLEEEARQQAVYEANRAESQSLVVGDRICRNGVFRYRTSAIGNERNSSGVLVAQFEARSPDGERLQFRILGSNISDLAKRGVAPLDPPMLGDFVTTPGLVFWDDVIYWQDC